MVGLISWATQALTVSRTRGYTAEPGPVRRVNRPSSFSCSSRSAKSSGSTMPQSQWPAATRASISDSEAGTKVSTVPLRCRSRSQNSWPPVSGRHTPTCTGAVSSRAGTARFTVSTRAGISSSASQPRKDRSRRTRLVSIPNRINLILPPPPSGSAAGTAAGNTAPAPPRPAAAAPHRPRRGRP